MLSRLLVHCDALIMMLFVSFILPPNLSILSACSQEIFKKKTNNPVQYIFLGFILIFNQFLPRYIGVGIAYIKLIFLYILFFSLLFYSILYHSVLYYLITNIICFQCLKKLCNISYLCY